MPLPQRMKFRFVLDALKDDDTKSVRITYTVIAVSYNDAINQLFHLFCEGEGTEGMNYTIKQIEMRHI